MYISFIWADRHHLTSNMLTVAHLSCKPMGLLKDGGSGHSIHGPVFNAHFKTIYTTI